MNETAAGSTLDERLAALACPVDRTMLDPAVQDSPWDFYRELHERCPVFPMPEIGAVMLTKYEDVRFVLTNPDLFSSSGRGGGTKKGLQVDNARRYQEILRKRGWGHVETLQRTDPPDVSPHRRQGVPPAPDLGDGRAHRRSVGVADRRPRPVHTPSFILFPMKELPLRFVPQ